MIRPILLVIFVVGLVLGGVYGLAVGKLEVFPHDLLVSAFDSIKESSFWASKKRSRRRMESVSGNTVDTVLLMLNVRELDVPGNVEKRPGGGMTSLGDEALIVTMRGDVLIYDGETLLLSNIETPKNGYDEYVAKAESKYSDYAHHYDRLRYNDLLYVNNGESSSLALSYIRWFDDPECYVNVVSLLPLPSGDFDLQTFRASASDWTEIYRSRPCLQMRHRIKVGIVGHMMGGRLTDLGNGKIAIANGEGNSRDLPQDDGSDMGRVVEISLDGSPARSTNKGLRNPLGILKDSKGRIWTVENAVYGGDELNLIQENTNYGWPYVSYGVEYNREPIRTASSYGRHVGAQPPVFSWMPSIGPSNLIEVSGFDPAWNGDLIVASMKARSLYRLRLSGSRVIYSEPILLGKRLRYIQMHTAGQILVWTDDSTLMVITTTPAISVKDTLKLVFRKMDTSDDIENKIESTIEQCLVCHNFVIGGKSDGAPSLSGLGGRKIAGGDYAGYSASLSSMSGQWTRESLVNFLIYPEGFAPGTNMLNTGLKDDELTNELAEFLLKLP